MRPEWEMLAELLELIRGLAREKPTNVRRDEFEERVGRMEDRSEFMGEALKGITNALDEHTLTQRNILKILAQRSKYLEDLSSKKKRK